jgi:hypothetical protein
MPGLDPGMIIHWKISKRMHCRVNATPRRALAQQ